MKGSMSIQIKTVSEGQPYRGPCSPVRKAIILAAGIGSRMGSFTEHTPKCLTPINGVSILNNMLAHLSDSGVKETIIIVGHLKEKIYDMIGTSFNGMKVSYIESDRYTTTNNISLDSFGAITRTSGSFVDDGFGGEDWQWHQPYPSDVSGL